MVTGEWIPVIWWILVLFPFVISPIFYIILQKNWTRLAAAVILLLILESIVSAFYSIYTFGGAFGPGMLLFCLSPLSTPTAVIIFIFFRRRFLRDYGQDRKRRKIYKIGMAIFIVACLSPFIGHFLIDAGCRTANKIKALPLIQALNTYNEEHTKYPETTEPLLPVYLDEIPSPGCAWLSGINHPNNAFNIIHCDNERTLLTSYTVDGASIHRYNFASGSWSGISFLDGDCNFLE